MPAPSIYVFADGNAGISRDLNDRVAASSSASISHHGFFTVAISGGSLPSILSKDLRHNTTIDWSKWHVFLADERCVPHAHPDSNYDLIKTSLLEFVPVPKDQVYPIAENLIDSPAAAAKDYQDKLAKVFGEGLPVFDMILLGMGPDGHTCSLFPGHSLLEETGLWVSSLTDSPKPPPSRITLTYPVLNAAREVVFVTTGDSKADVLHAILDLKEPYPSQRVAPSKPVVWLLDAGAASKLQIAT
ncbi:glucosamine-6-phosphate isomerases/6-phosphogluconolactonase-domain-containing protein, partial [Chytridium lagenaria]